MKNSEKGVKKLNCPSCGRLLPATLEHFMQCDKCKKWVCYKCLKKCDLNSLHLVCPDCISRIRIKYRLPVYITRCEACALKISRLHDN